MLDRTAATRWTRVAQVGAVGALALSAAAVVVSLPGGKPEHPPEVSIIPVSAPPTGVAVPEATAKPDGTAAGTRLGRISNKPTPAAPPEVAPPPPGPVTPPPADITYHGIVTIGTRSMALLKHNGTQRFVKLGDKVGEEPVEEIKPEHVRLGPAHLIPLADRSGSAVSRLQSVNPGYAQTTAPRPDANALRAAKLASMQAKENGIAPPFVPMEDVPMWRRMRAQLVLSGEYNMQDSLDEIAMKVLGERRDEFKANPNMTPEEEDAERAYLEKQGRGIPGGEK